MAFLMGDYVQTGEIISNLPEPGDRELHVYADDYGPNYWACPGNGHPPGSGGKLPNNHNSPLPTGTATHPNPGTVNNHPANRGSDCRCVVAIQIV